jgi:uncharacterized protein (TIGR02996 family)
LIRSTRNDTMLSDQEALLATIFDQPEEDAPRLVYADWLQEHDETEHAEFIRVQCEHVRTDFGSPERDACEARMALAWEAMRAKFAGEFPEIGEHDLSQYRRGFFDDYFDISCAQYVARAGCWWPRMPIRKIRTRLDSLNVRGFAECPELHRLEELALKGVDQHGTVIPILCRTKYLRTLLLLDLSEYTLGIEAAEALAVESFPRLKALRMPYNMRPNREAGKLLRKRFGDLAQF